MYDKNKTKAYNKYVEQRGKGCFTYFDVDEIEDIVLDFEADADFEGAQEALTHGQHLHPDSDLLKKLHVLILIGLEDFDQAELELAPYQNDGTLQTLNMNYALLIHKESYVEACNSYMKGVADGIADPEDALETFKHAVDFVPRDIIAKYIEEAYDLLLKAYEKDVEPDAEMLHDAGSLFASIEDFDKAAEALNKSLDIAPFDASCWWDLARCYFTTQQLDACLEACGFGLAVDPSHPMMHFVQGYLRTDKQMYKEAIEDFEICKKAFEAGDIEDLTEFELKEQLDNTYEQLAVCYSAIDKIDEALDCWKTLSIRKPGEAYPYYEMAILNMDKGNTPWALENLENVIRMEPKKSEVYALKASLLSDMHRFSEAIDTLDKLIKIKPRSQSALLAKAELCMHLNRIDEATATYKKLMKLNPKDPATRKIIQAFFSATGQEDELKGWVEGK